MREIRRKLQLNAAGLAAFVALAPAVTFSAEGESLNQRDTQLNSYQTNDRGSDDSLCSSTGYAMQALMDLAATKLPSAVKNGYTAYGKYRNAENLDKLKDQNAALANSMASVGSEPVLKVPLKSDTTYRRVNKNCLTTGENGRIAAEFEKQTGMKREEFLLHMTEISEKKIRKSDPLLIDKAFSRFEGFVQKIPNPEFRKNLGKSIGLVPDTMRRGLVAQAVQKFTGLFADAGSTITAPSTTKSPSDVTSGKGLGPEDAQALLHGQRAATNGGSGAEGSGKNGSGKDEQTNRQIAQTAGKNLLSSPSTGANSKKFRGVVEEALVEAVASQALEEKGGTSSSGELSIFQQISRRYRILTPQIAQLPGESSSPLGNAP